MLKRLALLYFIGVFFACKTTRNQAKMSPEPYRPNFHFTPPSMWMNDPNGMVFFEGEYHLFYQYYPGSTVWGPMHWGHAVSRDLVHWEHLPIALYPDSLGLIFSGSAVVDWNNTSGFGQNGKPPLVAIFTQHLMEGEKAGRHDFQYQSIAYSNDRGRTWTKYRGNPVIPNTEHIHDFRDPKVIWNEESQKWLMVFAAKDQVKFWSSPDLKHWTHLSDFGKEWGAHGGVWECPDFFPMTVAGTNQKKWVLLQSLNPGSPNGGSGTQYFIGDFDGKTFSLDPACKESVSDGKALWLDWGRDNYAGVTWSDIPKPDGRRLFLGWMSNWDYAMLVPTKNWRSAMTIPRELTLEKTSAGLRVFSQPARELKRMRKGSYNIERQEVNENLDISQKSGFSPANMEVELEIEIPEGAKTTFGLVLANTKGETYRVGFDAVKNEFFSDRTHAGQRDFSKNFAEKIHTATRPGSLQTIKLHLFFDVASCELFADDGAVSMTDIFFPSENFERIGIFAENGSARVVSGKVYQLQGR